MQAQNFLTATVGLDGYQALSKAAERLQELESVFVPRAIIAWLDCATRLGFEGQVPGTQARLAKGAVDIDGQLYELGAAQSQERLRAGSALIMALLDDVSIPSELDPKQVARLGKSIDTLVKARFIAMVRDLEAAAEVTPGEATGSSETSESSSSSSDVDILGELSKAEGKTKKKADWKASDGMTIPRAGTPERQAWDQKYMQAMADRFAGGDASKLVPVKVPVSEHAYGHYVGSNPNLQPRYRVPMYQKMLAAGDQLPPVFAQRHGNVFQIIDGNARLKAALAHGATELEGYELAKGIEEPGKAAKPRGPAKPDAPDAAVKAGLTGSSGNAPKPAVGVPKGPGVPEQPPALAPIAAPKPVVSRTRGFYKSELVRACPRCGQTQMRGRQLVGCLCITDVLQAAELVQKSEGDRLLVIGADAVIVALEDVLGFKPE